MYKFITPQEHKNYFGFASTYTIEGLLSYGAWDVEKQFGYFEKTLLDIDPEAKIKRLEGFLSNILEVKVGTKYYWFCVSYGGAQLSEYIHLACQFGSKKNIHIGSCGGLYKEAKSLDLIVPNYSYGNESITRIYERGNNENKHFSDVVLSNLIKQKILENNKEFIEGPIMTCMAMMGESFDDVKKWSEDGFFGVEMETSTVFSVSNNFNTPSAAILYISDNLINGQTVGDETHIAQKKTRDSLKLDLYNMGLKILLGIK